MMYAHVPAMLIPIVAPIRAGAKEHSAKRRAIVARMTGPNCLYRRGLALALPLAVACSSGEVAIELILPEDPALSPAGDRLAQLTLLTWEPGQAPRSESRAIDDTSAGLDMGLLEAGRPVNIAIELTSVTQRLIGYGASPLPVSPSSSDDSVVTIQVRRPYVYAAGSPARLDAFDSTLDPGQAGIFGGIAVSAPLASAPTPDGAELVVVAGATGDGAELRLVSTSSHALSDSAAVPVAGAVSDVAVTADGALAVVAHGGDDGGLSVVDLEAARAGQAEVSFVALGPVGAVVVGMTPGTEQAPGQPRAFALVSRSRAFGCDDTLPASSLEVVRLAAELAVDSSIDLAGPIADVAVAPDAGTVYLADPCASAVTSLAIDQAGVADASGPAELFALEEATAVAVQAGRIWGAGVLPPQNDVGARVVLVFSDPLGGGSNRVELAPAQERARSSDFEGEDQRVEVVIEADDLRPFELVALPGRDLVALLTEGYFHSEEWYDPIVGPVVSELELTTYEYLLVQTSTRGNLHRLRTWCEGTATSDAVFANFECGTASDQQTVAEADAYIPLQISALFGGR
jgi:hypothetical protein